MSERVARSRKLGADGRKPAAGRACCRSPGKRSTGCRSRPGRIAKFLLRREIYWEGPGETWSRKHRSWLTSVQVRRSGLAGDTGRLSARPRRADRPPRPDRSRPGRARGEARPVRATVARLRCLRGIDTLSALGLCAEIGEWERFDHPDQLSAYLGVVPSEHTTGASAAARVDHEGGLHPRPPAAGRGRLPLPPRPRRRSSARAPPARPRTRDHPHLLAARSVASTPAGANSKTPATSPAGSSPSRSPANSPPTAGRSQPARPQRPEPTPAPTTRKRLTNSR